MSNDIEHKAFWDKCDGSPMGGIKSISVSEYFVGLNQQAKKNIDEYLKSDKFKESLYKSIEKTLKSEHDRVSENSPYIINCKGGRAPND